jgi:hypothetical protein
MNLVECSPQELRFVPPPMPPIENERGDEVRDHPTGNWSDDGGQVEDGPEGQPALPGHARDQDNGELHQVSEQHAKRPSPHLRQRPSWDCSLKEKATSGQSENRCKHRASA